MRDASAKLLVSQEGSGRTSIAYALAEKLATISEGPLAGYSVTLVSPEDILLAESALKLMVQLHEAAGPKSILFVDDLEVSALLGSSFSTQKSILLELRMACERADLNIIMSIAQPYLLNLQNLYPEFFDELEVFELSPLPEEIILELVRDQAVKLSWYHEVTIDDAAISAACSTPAPAEKIAHPALALQRLDRAAAQAAHGVNNRVTVDIPGTAKRPFVRELVSAGMRKRIKGQDHAIETVINRLGITRTGLDLRPRRPDAVFMLAGPTGVGKTEFALSLAEQVYGSREAVLRLDMSEFRSEHEAARLVGPPPGYKGSDRPEEWLTTKIIENPHRVLLLDEFEKAHPAVWQTFLQVFDAGRLTDGRGRQANFRDTIILLTSNLGAGAFADREMLGFGEKPQTSAAVDQRLVMRAIKDELAPELINRLDDVIVFRPLSRESVHEITLNAVESVCALTAKLGFALEFTPAATGYLSNKGYSREYGARPLQRVIEDEVMAPISSLSPAAYLVDVKDSKLIFEERGASFTTSAFDHAAPDQ